MSERNDITTTGGDGHGPADPLARIGTRLIEAAQVQRRRRRRQHLQRAAGAVLTLLLVVAAVVVARPFAGAEAPQRHQQPLPASRQVELPAGSGRVSVWESHTGALCMSRPGGDSLVGITTCGTPRVLTQLMASASTAWLQAVHDGDEIVVSGLVAVDSELAVSVARTTSGQRPRALVRRSGPTVAVDTPGTPLRVRPFAVAFPADAVGGNVWVDVPRGGGQTPGTSAASLALKVPIGGFAPPRVDGWKRLSYTLTSGSATASRYAETIAARIAPTTRDDVQVMGAGNRITIDLPNADAAAADLARATLSQARLGIADWEGALATTAPTSRAVATAIARRVRPARVVEVRDEAIAPRGFYVLRGPPTVTNADLGAISASGRPLMLIFRGAGAVRLRDLMRAVARRGQQPLRPGGPPASRHYAVIVDDVVIALNAVDPRRDPDGFADGLVRVTTLPERDGRALSRRLTAGPLPPLVELPRP